MRTTFAIGAVPLALIAGLSGCSGQGGGDAVPSSSPSPAATIAPMTDAVDTGPTVNSSAQPHAIPAAMVGKWGIGLADCDPSTGADKGAMTVSSDGLKFFESRAQLAAVISAGPGRIRGVFSYDGEGMKWTLKQELTLQPGGKSLVRRELDGDPPTAPTTYLRCPRSKQETS